MLLRFGGNPLPLAGCDRLGEAFDVRDQRIVQQHSGSEPVTRTLLGRESRRLRAGHAALILLNGNARYTPVRSSGDARGGVLVLESPSDTNVPFRGDRTAGARFARSGQTLCFDIAPGTVQCLAADTGPRDGLLVREFFGAPHARSAAGYAVSRTRRAHACPLRALHIINR